MFLTAHNQLDNSLILSIVHSTSIVIIIEHLYKNAQIIYSSMMLSNAVIILKMLIVVQDGQLVEVASLHPVEAQQLMVAVVVVVAAAAALILQSKQL